MHAAAREFLEEHAQMPLCLEQQAVDFGGRYVNGDVHDLWPDHKWTVVDNHPGPIFMSKGMPLNDINFRYLKVNAARWTPDVVADLAICTEVFEHTKEWPSICKVAHQTLSEGGIFLVTAAGEGRTKHSMYDGGPLREHEYYANVSAHQLAMILKVTGFRCKTIYNPHDKDVYAVAVKIK